MAGLNAQCTATAFPQIMIGNGKSDSGDFIKSITDVTNAVSNDLNPSYYKLYELDAKLPED